MDDGSTNPFTSSFLDSKIIHICVSVFKYFVHITINSDVSYTIRLF